MIKRRFSKLILQTLTLAAFLAFTANIWAQDEQDTEAEDDAELTKIFVTGSRIKADDFSSASPIQVINMETSSLAGVLDISDILQGSTIAASGAQVNNLLGGFVVDGGSGVNTVDLRGLGAG